MKKTIVLAGAAGALALAGVAIAQQPAQDTTVNPNATATERNYDGAQPAGAYAEDTAAQSDYGMAGERG